MVTNVWKPFICDYCNYTIKIKTLRPALFYSITDLQLVNLTPLSPPPQSLPVWHPQACNDLKGRALFPWDWIIPGLERVKETFGGGIYWINLSPDDLENKGGRKRVKVTQLAWTYTIGNGEQQPHRWDWSRWKLS